MKTDDEMWVEYKEWVCSAGHHEAEVRDFGRLGWLVWKYKEKLYADALETVALIEELRAEEPPRITLLSDGIEVYGKWTRDGISQTFYGDNLLDCLRQAAEAKRVATKSA